MSPTKMNQSGLRPFQWLVIGLLMALGLKGLLMADEPRFLTIEQIIMLPDTPSVNGMPVVTRGVLTYHEPGHRMAFIQDANRAMYVHVAGNQDVSPGDYVEVRGFLDPGLNGRNIRGRDFDTSPLIRKISRGTFPEPLRIDSLAGIENREGARWTRSTLRIKAVTIEGDRARLIVDDYPHVPVFVAGIPRPSMLPNHLTGLVVEADGVIADSPVSEKPLVLQRQVLLPGLKFIHIPPIEIEKLFKLPESGLSDLRWLQEREGPDIRARILGRITWVKPGEGFFVQRGNMGAWVQSSSPEVPELGQLVECSGRPSSYNGSGILNAALWREAALEVEIDSVEASTPGEPKADTSQGRLTRIDGILVEMFRSPSEDLAILQMGSDLVFSHLSISAGSGRLPPLEKGSRVALSGVFLNRPSPALSAAETQGSYHLLVRTAGDLQVLSAPPFWNTRRLVILLAALVTTALLAGIWVLALRRKVRKQEILIRNTIAKQVVEEERVRIAREWHDSFEQHFAGLTMLLDATAAVVPSGSQASGMLERAARMADHSRAEARHAIWDLRASAIKSHVPFATELEETLLHSWPEDATCRLQIECRERSEILPRSHTLHLLRIAQEAVTNAIKHSRCSNIRVVWDSKGSQLELAITDDGMGLSAGTHDLASQEGHFGLLGMRERALRIHGTLEILSPPHDNISGTCVRISITQPSRES
jgi:signal transduction histidine kinase